MEENKTDSKTRLIVIKCTFCEETLGILNATLSEKRALFKCLFMCKNHPEALKGLYYAVLDNQATFG